MSTAPPRAGCRVLLGFAAVGAVLGVFNPVGPRLVAYPLSVITHHSAFAHIVEWQSPSFSDPVNLAFLVAFLVAVILLVARRGTVEDVLVVAFFGAAASHASRNVPVAALLITPVLARGLAGLGTIEGTGRGLVPASGLAARWRSAQRSRRGRSSRPAYDFSLYPVHEVSWLSAAPPRAGPGGDHRLRRELPRVPLRHQGRRLHRRPGRHLSGCGREGLRGLAQWLRGWKAVLARYRFDAVLWPRSDALASLISEDPGWTVRISDRRWIVAVRTPSRG